MVKYQTFGAYTPEESEREQEHKALARRAAAEGIVLLKNDGVLPLTGRIVALYGPGSRMTVKGGSGSGDVHERHSVTIEEGLRNAGFLFPTTLWMDRFENKYNDDVTAWRQDVENKIKGFTPLRTMRMFDVIHENPMPFPACTPILTDELTDKTDTAIYVLSRQAGEGKDRRVEKGDYLLSDLETESLKTLSAHYKRLILVLNCGGVIDLSVLDETRIDAVFFYGQGGMEGGNALADLLTGKAAPCGKLTDTWAMRYEDYPCADTFSYRNGDLDNEEYSEGIYVGYRWFDKNGIKPRYPFGFGLSYTTFEMTSEQATDHTVTVTVKNTGNFGGKEVLQLYVAKPDGRIDHEKRGLAAFAKTRLLQPGESTTVTLPIDLKDIAAFDENKSAFVLEKGEYRLILNDMPCGSVTLEDETIIEKVNPIGSGKNTKPYRRPFSEKVSALLRTLSDREKIKLVTGGGYALKAYNNVMGAAGRTCTGLLKKGIPNIVLADGPAGLNVNQSVVIMKDGTPRYPDGLPEDWKWGWLKHFERFVKAKPGKGRPVYRYMTAWPSETVLAQSWDTKLMEEVGRAVGKEMLEIGVSVWLAPGLNIHRNPLCGRNFEYYSEDPILSGKMAASVTRGVQSRGGIGVTVKHFCCNNQEDNRSTVSENVSQRALRELYLRGFRIAVTEGGPWTVMTGYNRVNGVHVCNNYDFCTRILRQEWGFDGVVMSDWNATDQCSHAEAVNAGNDLIMPGSKAVEKALQKALKEGTLNRDALNTSAGRILEMIFASDTCKGF
ncbi:MAG: beta-glucosidase [Lachnospiraceae bacterium]|nr:beta-glucosidase [Lachnospiraceae bacterium]